MGMDFANGDTFGSEMCFGDTILVSSTFDLPLKPNFISFGTMSKGFVEGLCIFIDGSLSEFWTAFRIVFGSKVIC